MFVGSIRKVSRHEEPHFSGVAKSDCRTILRSELHSGVDLHAAALPSNVGWAVVGSASRMSLMSIPSRLAPTSLLSFDKSLIARVDKREFLGEYKAKTCQWESP
jgi:hypothetical protein